MEQHVKIISVIDIVFGILGVIAGVIMTFAFIVGGAVVGTAGEQGAGGLGALVASLGLVGGLFVMGLGALEIVVGVHLRDHRPWARIAQIIYGVISLPGFPIGTVFGVYVLWAMLNKETTESFEQHKMAA